MQLEHSFERKDEKIVLPEDNLMEPIATVGLAMEGRSPPTKRSHTEIEQGNKDPDPYEQDNVMVKVKQERKEGEKEEEEEEDMSVSDNQERNGSTIFTRSKVANAV